MSDNLSFKFTLTEDDFVSAVRASARSKRRWWNMWAVRLGFLFALYVYLSDIVGMTGKGPLVAILLLVAIFTGAFWWLWWWHPKRVAREAPYLDVEIDGTASVNGVASHSRLGNHESTWDSYSAAFESADHFLLYLGRNVFNPFPKRAFINPGDVDRFRDLIRAHIQNARLLDRREK